MGSMVSLAHSLLAVAILVLAFGKVECQSLTPVAPGPSQTLANLPDLPGYQVVQLLCERVVTSQQYVQALLDRYESGGYSCLNIFINTFNATKVLEDAAAIDAKAARGENIRPLCGMPLAVKDAIDVVGYPTTCATPSLKDNYPLVNPPLIQQYLNANGVIMGKTNLGEMQDTITAINPTSNGISTPLNAYDPTRIAGGSSGGSGSAVAVRVAPFALCEDTGGSCRSPAIANGVFGLRPSLGAYDVNDGLVPAFVTTDTVGSIGRTAEDVILLDSIVRRPNCTTSLKGALNSNVSCDVEVDRDLNLTGIRLGLPSTIGWQAGLSAEIVNITNVALEKMRGAGAVLVPFDSSAITDAAARAWPGVPGSFPTSAYESPLTLARWLYRRNTTLSVVEMINQMNRPSTKAGYSSYLNASADSDEGSDDLWMNYIKQTRPALTQAWIDAIENNDFDALLYPVYTTEITRVDSGDAFNVFRNASGTYVITFRPLIYTSLDAQAALTAGAFPIGFGASGTPAGLQVSAVPGNDQMVLSLMLAFEKLLGPMTAPPLVAPCKGCIANVSNVKPNYAVGASLNSSSVWTNFGLTFGGGTCNQVSLNSYGQDRLFGTGVLSNQTSNETLMGATVSSAG